MTKRTHISGLDEVVQNLNRRVEQIEGVTLKGLIRAGYKIKGEAQRLCPVVTGNLKASAYTNPLPSEDNPTVEIGFTAAYAAKVHENPRAGRTGGVSPSGQKYPPGTYSTVGQWKFLETALKQNENYVVDVIEREAGRTL